MDQHIDPTANEINKWQRKGKNVYAETETGIHLITGDAYSQDNGNGEEVQADTAVGTRKILGAKIHVPIKHRF